VQTQYGERHPDDFGMALPCFFLLRLRIPCIHTMSVMDIARTMA
jgi:hypothetical protein